MNYIEGMPKAMIKATYGHSYTIAEIIKKYPFSNETIDINSVYKQNVTITYNLHIAMQYKKKKIHCYIWGAKTNNGRLAFIFDKAKPALTF